MRFYPTAVLFLLGLAGAGRLFPAAAQSRPPGEPSKTTITAYEATARPGPVRILPSADSILVGMYSAADGHEILPPRYYNVMGYEPGDTVRDPIIFLMDSARNRYGEAGFTVLPGYEIKCGAFTRGGSLLYEPVWYDNGPDYWSEGRQRFVYDNRMGFVNRFGAVAVPARYPFVTPYRAGKTWACKDCTLKVTDSADAEHGTSWVGKRWVMLDKAGVEGPERTEPGDSYYAADAERWPPMDATEARLAAALRASPAAALFRQAYHLEPAHVAVRVYDRPTPHSPYYHLALEEEGSAWFSTPEYQFLVSPDGKTVLHLAGPGMRAEGLEAWMARERAAAARVE